MVSFGGLQGLLLALERQKRAGRVHCHFSRGQGKCCRGQDVVGCVAVRVCEGDFKTNMKWGIVEQQV